MTHHISALAAAGLIALAGSALAQQPASPAAPAQKMDMKMCQEMSARHQKTMDEMKQMDARLQEQVKAMQAASGDAKVDAMARVVSTLAEQRMEMRQRAMSMDRERMGHMMEHSGQDRATMMQCPMMKQMAGPQPPR